MSWSELTDTVLSVRNLNE